MLTSQMTLIMTTMMVCTQVFPLHANIPFACKFSHHPDAEVFGELEFEEGRLENDSLYSVNDDTPSVTVSKAPKLQRFYSVEVISRVLRCFYGPGAH